MSARPARCTTCPCCWPCWRPPGSWKRRRRTPPFWVSWRWTAACGPCPACCRWHWKPLPAGCGRSTSRRRTPPRPLRPAAARCRSSPLQRPVRSWTLCGASSPSRLRLLFPSTLPTHGTMSPISPTSAVSRWPAGRWSLPLQAGTTSCSSAHPAPANPCWPGVFPASCPR